MLKGAAACLRICGHIKLCRQNISQALYFENSLFRFEQLMMLFAAQEVLNTFRVIHCTV